MTSITSLMSLTPITPKTLTTTLLSAEALSVNGDGVAIAPISFSLQTGQRLTLLGETGSGKSLIAQAVMGTLPKGLIASGQLTIAHHSCTAEDTTARRALWGHTLALLPQEPWHALDPTMRALPQVAETHRFVAGRNKSQATRAARDDLTQLGLEEGLNKLPGELSGGMAQRVAFAAASAAGAPIVIADEPTKGLDAPRRDEVVELLAKTPDAGGALLTITHDIDVARRLGGEVIILRKGQVVERGPAEQLLEQPQTEYAQRLIGAEPSRWPAPSPFSHEASSPVVSASGLGIARGGRQLFSDLDVAVRPGEIIGVVGPSGCGKSTLGDMLLGIAKPDRGTITYRDDIPKLGRQKLYQDPPAAFSPHWTLIQLLEDLLRRHQFEHCSVAPLMERLGLNEHLLGRRPGEISGGELQRFAILRVLLLKPSFLFADEPTSRLDPITQQQTLNLLIELAREQACAVMLVSHDPGLIEKVCDQTLSLSA